MTRIGYASSEVVWQLSLTFDTTERFIMSIENEELDAGDYAGFLEEAEALRMQTESTAGGSTST